MVHYGVVNQDIITQPNRSPVLVLVIMTETDAGVLCNIQLGQLILADVLSQWVLPPLNLSLQKRLLHFKLKSGAHFVFCETDKKRSPTREVLVNGTQQNSTELTGNTRERQGMLRGALP